jgi:hypothetical protein
MLSWKSNNSIHRLKLFFAALGIDILPALFFINTLIIYNYRSEDVGIERFIYLTVTPIFNGVNFLIILILYIILSRTFLPWYILITTPILVFILSYPALYIGAHITTLLRFKFPE